MSGKNENSRIETFSDGIFAIAITLLILEIKVPAISSVHSVNDLWHALAKLWPSYFAFVLSFGFILIAWLCHHALFNVLDKSSAQFIYANGFLLLNIVFLPFPTALLAQYVMTDYAQPAVLVYSFSNLLANISWNMVYSYALKPTILTKDNKYIEAVKSMRMGARYGFIFNCCITLLAWWFPLTALAVNTLLWLLWIKMSTAFLHKEKSSAEFINHKG